MNAILHPAIGMAFGAWNGQWKRLVPGTLVRMHKYAPVPNKYRFRVWHCQKRNGHWVWMESVKWASVGSIIGSIFRNRYLLFQILWIV